MLCERIAASKHLDAPTIADTDLPGDGICVSSLAEDCGRTASYFLMVNFPLRKSMVTICPRRKSRPRSPSTTALGGRVWANTGKFVRSKPSATILLIAIRGAYSTPLPVVT
jgi:hypothetical protein